MGKEKAVSWTSTASGMQMHTAGGFTILIGVPAKVDKWELACEE